MLKCKYCQKECKNENSLRNHERCCPHNQNRIYKNGMLGKKGSNQFVYAKANNLPTPINGMTGKKSAGIGLTPEIEAERIRKISEKLSINNKGGRAKWYEVAGQNVQGTWERDIAMKFEQLNIRWIKLKTNKDTLKYEMNGQTRSYTPDFYLPDYDMIIEVKGFWWGDDKEKMKIVLDTYPDKNIVIVEKEEYEEIIAL